MKVAVIFLEKKFIVVIPKECSVAELRTEIERVHRALFQSSDPPQPVTEIQTLSGCVLYGGYTVSSVLSDNDTVIASGPGSVTPSTGDGITNSPQLCAYTPPSQFSFYGHNPLSYYSPVVGAHNMLSHGHLGGSPYTPPQSRILPPLLDASKMSLFQSPSAKTVASQCPSPEHIRGEALQSQPRPSNSERECEDSRLEITDNTEDKGSEEASSESPLGDLSHLAKTTPQKNILFSTPAPTPSDSSEGAVELTGVRKRKRIPQGRPQDSKKKQEKAGKSGLEERKGALHKGDGKGQKELVRVQNKGSVYLVNTDTGLPEEIKANSKPPSQSNADKSSAKFASDSSPSSPFILGTDNTQHNTPSPQSPLVKKRKLSKTTTKNGNKQTVPKKTATKGVSKPSVPKTKAVSKAKTSSNDDSGSSGWPTTSDESEGEVVKEKTPPSKRKRLKAVTVERVSKHEENPPKKPSKKQALKSDSSSEWETDDDTKNTTSFAKPASSASSSATQKSLGPSQTNNRKAKASARPQKQPQSGTKPLNRKGAPAEISDLSSSEWDTDEEDQIETDSKSHKDKEPSQPTKINVKTGREQIESCTRGDKKAVKGENSTKSTQERNEKSNSESEQGESQSEKLFNSWSSPSPNKRYTAQDGRLLRQKKLEDLKNCSKASNLMKKVTTDTTEAASGANVLADTDAQRVEQTTEENNSDNSIEKDREDIHESDEHKETVGTRDVEDKEDTKREVEASDSPKETEVLAPNSLPSDEEVQMEIQSKPQDEVTVIQETQDSSRSPSPEIPLLIHPSNPSHQSLLATRQKMQEKLTLRNSPPASDFKTSKDGNAESDKVKKRDSNAEGNQVKKKKKKMESTRKHSDSETDVLVSDSSAQEKKKKKNKQKKTKDDKSTSDNAAESSDATISGASDSKQLPKEKPTKSKEDLSESETTGSQSQLDDRSNEKHSGKSKAKRKKQKREVKVLSSLDQVPSSQTDASEEEGTLVIDNETEILGNKKSKETAEVDHDSSATVSDAQQSSGERKKLKKKKKQKNKSALPATQSSVRDEVTETSQSVLEPPVEAAKSTESVDDSENLGEGTTTDTDMMDITSECSVTPSPSAKIKKKKKRKKKTMLQSHAEATAKNLSEKSGRNMTDKKDSSAEEDEEGHKDDDNDDSSSVQKKKTVSLSSKKADSSKDGFLKPTAIPPSKASPNRPPKVQLSPAAGISSPNRGSPSKVKKNGQSKEPSLLSVFSVTETESEESSSERVNSTSRVSHEKKSRKLNFLSSLGSHGKKVHPARPSPPFSRSSILTPSPSSRFSSDTAVRMFSFSHSPRSSAHKVRPHISPAKTPPAKRKHNEDSIGASLDQLLKETQGEGGDGGSGKVSVSDLLADGSLWDT